MSTLFCSCLQFSVLTRFVCRICLHFGPVFGGVFCRQSLSAGFVCILARVRPIFCRQGLSAEFVRQGFLCRQTLSAETADKVCLQGLSAFWPSFRRIFGRQGLSAGFVCNICLHFGQGSADFLQTKFVCRVVCQGFLCRQTLSAETADKLCLQNLLTKFVCRTAADKLCLHVHQFVCNIHQMTNFVYSRQTLSTV